jgi:hypothetical protein
MFGQHGNAIAMDRRPPMLHRPRNAEAPTRPLRLHELWRAAARRSVLWPSARTATVVGVILNVVNQADAILDGRPVSLVHLALNFVVPFCVAGYSAARQLLQRQPCAGCNRGACGSA